MLGEHESKANASRRAGAFPDLRARARARGAGVAPDARPRAWRPARLLPTTAPRYPHGAMRAPSLIVGAVLALAALTSSGCTAFYWSKPGSTPEQFAMDNEDCVKQAAPSPAVIGYGVMVQEAYRGCLRARGYVRSKQYEPVPPGYYRGVE
jgi:hypothetical protein